MCSLNGVLVKKTGSTISIESVKKNGNPTGRGSRNEIEAAACAASLSRSSRYPQQITYGKAPTSTQEKKEFNSQ
jgi:hypothetical protein